MTIYLPKEIKMAELFHDTYETLAPSYGYETRKDTKAFDPQSKNGQLMIAVCSFIASQIQSADIESIIEKVEKMYGQDIFSHDNKMKIGYEIALDDIIAYLKILNKK